MMRFGLRLATLLALLTVLAIACGSDEESQPAATTGTPRPLEKITFMAGFKAQANLPFVGAYVAKEKGFFQEQGLDVDIQHSTGGSQHVQLLVSGQVQFTTADAANVLQRIADPGLPLVAIALIGQTGQQGWVTLRDFRAQRSNATGKGRRSAYRKHRPSRPARHPQGAGHDPR